MDLGEKSNHYRAIAENGAQASLREKIAAKKAWLKREREERGLPEDACLHCGGQMEQRRLGLDLPDCEKCRRQRVQDGLPIPEMVSS